MRPFAEVLSSEILALEIASDTVAVTTEASFHGAGAATVNARGQGLVRTEMTAVGASTVAFFANPQFNISTEFEAAGAAGMQAHGNGVMPAVATAHGTSELVFRRGREVRLSLPPAFDMVERPEESRLVEWSES